MTIKSWLVFGALVLAVPFVLVGCAGDGGGEAGGSTAEEQHGEAKTETVAETDGGGDSMTDQDALKPIAEKLGVSLDDLVSHESGMQWIVREEGTGEVPVKGQTISAHYTGYLLDGTKFDSSVDRGQPFSTAIGVQRVIRGWDIAFTDMKVGEKRVLIIPPELGYGSRGAGGVIPPGATLVFDVELLDILN